MISSLGNTLKSLHRSDSPLRMSASYLSTSSASSDSTDVFLNCWTSRQLIFTETPRKRYNPSLPAPQLGHSEARLFSFSELLCLSMMNHSLLVGGGHLPYSGSKQNLDVWKSWNLEGSQGPFSLQYHISIRIAQERRLFDLSNCLLIWRAPGYHFLWVSSGLSVMPLSLSHPCCFKAPLTHIPVHNLRLSGPSSWPLV